MKRPPFDRLGEWTLDVEYVKEKAKFTYELDQTGWRKNMFPVVRCKFDDWAYEKEVRVIFPPEDEFIPIPPATIRSVVFGCRCHPADQKRLTQILHQTHYAHVEIVKAEMMKDCFALGFKILRPGTS